MPNHFHGLVRIVRPGGKGLGEVVNVFKGAVTRKWRVRLAGRAGSRYSEKEPQSGTCRVWAPNYYDVICFNADELEIKKNYILANPRRWALRDVPRGFIKQSAYAGNVELLKKQGERLPLRVSRRVSDADIDALKKILSGFDGTVCSTFFSAGERACLDVLQGSNSRIIWVLPMAIPENIPVGWTNPFLENRALWLSAFPSDLEDATRTSCEQANQWVKQFCKGRNV